ncbi:hypothetical protein ACFQ1I_20280 [Kitasatospora arboriphila]
MLVVEDGPRVIDFGIAAGVSHTRLTMTNVAVGTPAYMSPEQARDSRSVTGASDVFSLGSLLVFCATGHPRTAAPTRSRRCSSCCASSRTCPGCRSSWPTSSGPACGPRRSTGRRPRRSRPSSPRTCSPGTTPSATAATGCRPARCS